MEDAGREVGGYTGIAHRSNLKDRSGIRIAIRGFFNRGLLFMANPIKGLKEFLKS